MLKSSVLSLVFIPHQAIFRMIPKDEICKLPSDENTVDKRTEKLWKFFKKSEKGENLLPDGTVVTVISVSSFLQPELSFCFSLLIPDRVTESEFIQGVLENEAALRLIQYQPLK